MSDNEIISMPSIGYWSALSGLEVKKITDSEVIAVSGCWNGCKKTVHRVKIRSRKASRRNYVVIRGYRLDLDDICSM